MDDSLNMKNLKSVTPLSAALKAWFWHWMILRRRWWIGWQRSSAPRRNARKVSLRWHWSFWSRICRPCHTTLPMRVWLRPWFCSSRKSSSMNVSVNKPPSGQDTGQIVSPPFFFGYPPTGRRTWTEGSGFLPATASSEGGTGVIPNVLKISLDKNRKMADVPNSFPRFWR